MTRMRLGGGRCGGLALAAAGALWLAGVGQPALAGDEVLAVVAETSGTPVPFIRAALAYWSDYPEEVDDFLHRARTEAEQAQAAWERQQGLLGL